MAKTPADRYRSYNELLADIEFTEPVTSRSAGFLVRAFAVFLDFIFVSVMVSPSLLIFGDGDLNGSLIVAWMPYQVFFLARFGTTPGRRILGIEVISSDGGTGLGYKNAAIRILIEYGMLIGLWGGSNIADQLEFETASTWLGVAAAAVAVTAIIHVLRATFRSESSRTTWDRVANTQVRTLRLTRPLTR